MAKLVIGTDKTNGTPALVKEVGIIPTGTLSITENGTYDVTNYASADVNTPVPPVYYIEKTVDANNKLQNSSTIMNLNGFTDIGDYVLNGAYGYNPNISGSVVFQDLTQISGESALEASFRNCPGLTGVTFSQLKSISGASACYSAFYGCTGLTSVDLSHLTSVTGNNSLGSTFENCKSLTSVDLSGLVSINTDAAFSLTFSGCTSLTTLSFPALKIVSSRLIFSNILNGVTGCTVHFPSNLSNYSFNLGGTNTTILYDLPATV